MAVSGTATHRHAPHLNSSTTSSSSLSLTTRLANFMGFQSRHQQQSPRTPPDQGVDHDPWIAVPQPQASTSSFGAGTLRSIRTLDGTAGGGGGGHYGVSAFSSEEGGSSFLQPHHQQPAVGAGLSPYLTIPNAFAKQQQQQHSNTSQAPPPPRSSSPWGDSGSSFSSPSEPARTGGFFRSTASASGHSTSAAPPAPSTSKVSPLKQRLRTSGLFPTSTSSSSVSPSKQGSKKLHYMQASLAAFDGGIGESPVPAPVGSRKGKERALQRSDSVAVKEKEKEKEREKIRKKEKESGMKFPSYYSPSPPPPAATSSHRDRRHSPLSPLIGFASSSHHHQSPTIGKALGVRTSLLGFGTESPLGRWDTSSPAGTNRGNVSDATDMFDKPRKAPLPPGHTPSPSTTSASVIFGDEEKVESHSRKPSIEAAGGYLPGGPSTLGPVREESEGQMSTSQEGSGGGDGRQAEREEERLSPAPQRQYVVVTPPPPQDDGVQEATIPLPPSASSHHTESSRQPSPTSTFPSPISPISPNQFPPPIRRANTHQRTRSPNEGSGSTTQKPPIPPKSADTIRLAQGANALKSYSSTPNLLAAAFGNAAAGDVNTSPSKGKGKERVQVDEALNTHRSPSSAAAGATTTTASRLVHPHLLQAQTICDALMFPKPRFVAHVISPPGTPEAFSAPSRQPPPPPPSDPSSSSRPPYLLPEILPTPPLSLDKVIREGEQRERERDQWAAKASRSLLSRNLSTRSRSHTDASGGSQRGRNLSVASGSTGGGGLVNRLRARTLSGRKAQGKGHRRGGSKETEQTSEMGEYEGGARIGGRSGTLRLKKEGSYEFDTLRQRQMVQPRESPTPVSVTTAATASKPVPLGKQGKLSISLNEKDHHQATVSARGMTDSGGTVRSTHTTSNTTHSRKSSGQSRHGPFSSHPFASHSRSGSSGSVSNAASAASYAIRKVKSLCGPERLSPAAEETAFVGGSQEKRARVVDPAAAGRPSLERRATIPRESMYEDRMMEALSDRPLPIVTPQRQGPVLDVDEEEDDYGSGERHLVDPSYEVGVALGGEMSVPSSARDSAMAAASHTTSLSPRHERLNTPSPSQPDTASSHLDMDDVDDETGQIQHVVQRVSMTPAQSRQSISAVGGPSPIDIPNMRPVPTPSPSPSSYHGVYGIAIGTPNFNHPFVQSSQDRLTDISTLPAGPHPTSPTYLQLPVLNDLVSRHRLPPHRAPILPPPSIALPTPPVSSEHHETKRNTAESSAPSEYDDEPSSLMPIYAPSSIATGSTPPRRNAHPYAGHSPAPSLPRNYRMSVNSVEAMFGGELLESSHTVSPLGVREAGESWINSTDAEFKGLSTPAEEDEYRHSGDSGLGSSTEMHSHRRSTQSRHVRGKPSRAATQSSIGSMLIESPPPSMFPSFRQNRDSSMFDTMTFGPGDDFSVYEGDQSRPMSEIVAEPPAVPMAPPGPESVDSSSTSSIELQQRPLGSSDDLESFKDLFYVPRSRQPSASSPKFRRSEASGDSKLVDPDLHEIEAYARSLPSSETRSRSSTRILSPLSSVLEMRQSFAPDLDSPYRAHSLEDPNETVHYSGYFPPRASVYDIMEEDESIRSVSSCERNTEEDVRLGTVNVSAPYVTAGRTNRQSTQPSLFEDDSESPLPAMPVPRTRPSFLDTDSSNPAYRASYMTTTSGTSVGNRMSHIISDFPTPPINNPSSSGFLDFYTGSQAGTPDTHSFASTPQPLVPKPPLPFRTDSFGPQT